MIVQTIIDTENGRKWEIFKHTENRYSYKYYEYFQALGWHLTGMETNMTKDCIELDFEIKVA